MCMKCLAIILFLFAASPCAFGHNRQIRDVRPGYADSLNHVVQIFKNNNAPRSELVEYCMPQSKEESLLFFKLDYEKQSAREFRMLLHVWIHYALKDVRQRLINLYCCLNS